MKLSRRHFLGGVAAATALGGLERSSRATESPVSVLVLDFAGAWNIHASFAARTSPIVNPYGLYEGDTGVLTPSKQLFDDRDSVVRRASSAWGTKIPGFEDTARSWSLIGAMRHAETYDLDDHTPSAMFCGTGYIDRLDAPGLGTVISRYADKDRLAPPAVIVGKGYVAPFTGQAPGTWLPHAPFAVAPASLPVLRPDAFAGLRAAELERALDAPALGSRRALARTRVESLLQYKDAYRRYRKFLTDKAVHTAAPAYADERLEEGILGAASPTTQQLIDVFGGTLDGDEAALALAIRCLEGGSRFVAVGLGFWFRGNSHDTHEAEDDAKQLYVRDAQLLAGVTFLLEKLGLTKKVLVVGLSEMARCPYPDGYNAAGGTDHGHTGVVSAKKMFMSNRQSILLHGGPIRAGREAYAADPEVGDPIDRSCITAELLAFLAESAGVARDDHPWQTTPGGAAIDFDALPQALTT